MTELKHYFIINPISGTGLGINLSDNIKKYCHDNNIEYEIIFTKGPRDATAIVKNIKKKSLIFSVGGDGTLSEVVEGIYGSSHILGIIPSGSGNDFYKSLILKEDGLYKSAVYQVNDKLGINIMSVGIDAEVNDNAFIFKRNKKIPRGQVYNLALIYTFFKFKNTPLRIIIDGKEIKANTTLFIVSNGKYYGGGYKMSPNADFESDYLDLILVNNYSKLAIARIINKAKKGKHLNAKDIYSYKAKKIVIKSDKPISAQIDGEHMTNKIFKIKIMPKKINLYNNKQMIKEIIKNYE